VPKRETDLALLVAYYR